MASLAVKGLNLYDIPSDIPRGSPKVSDILISR